MNEVLNSEEMRPLTADKIQKLNKHLHFLQNEADHFLGYPCTREFDYQTLFQFLQLPMNNVGDPFRASRYHLNSHQFEREVVDFFARLCGADAAEVWGYVTNGGTEGNMYGIYLARELFPQGMLYYSEATHYSVPKILRMVNARSIQIRSQYNGEIDYRDLFETLKIHRDLPAIIFANIGTTMTGAVDNIENIKQILKQLSIKHYYIHCDAALGGMLLPFIEGAESFGFDADIDSIAISGHKMIGSPLPCGIALARKKHVDSISRAIEYIGTFDTTISGSRNAITPLFLWYAINTKGFDGFKKICQRCIEIADYAIAELRAIGIEAWRNPNSITVVFARRKVPEIILKRWQIATEKDFAHLITMSHVSRNHIDRFIQDIRQLDQEVA